MTYPVFPYEVLGSCALVQPLSIHTDVFLGLGGRAARGNNHFSLKLVIPHSDEDRKSSWNHFYDSELVHGTSPFALVLPDLDGLKMRAVRFTRLDKPRQLDDGTWSIDLEVEDLGVDMTCYDDPNSCVNVEAYYLAEMQGSALKLTSKQTPFTSRICFALGLDFEAHNFEYAGELQS